MSRHRSERSEGNAPETGSREFRTKTGVAQPHQEHPLQSARGISKGGSEMFNEATLIGRLGADPEIRHTQNGTPVALFQIATNERWKDGDGETQERTEWHRIVAWDNLANVCGEYLKKGKLVFVKGPIRTRTWEDKDGNTRRTTEIVARTMQMLDRAGEAGKEDVPPPMDEDIPF